MISECQSKFTETETETFVCVSHMLASVQLHGYCMLVNLRDDRLNFRIPGHFGPHHLH